MDSESLKSLLFVAEHHPEEKERENALGRIIEILSKMDDPVPLIEIFEDEGKPLNKRRLAGMIAIELCGRGEVFDSVSLMRIIRNSDIPEVLYAAIRKMIELSKKTAYMDCLIKIAEDMCINDHSRNLAGYEAIKIIIERKDKEENRRTTLIEIITNWKLNECVRERAFEELVTLLANEGIIELLELSKNKELCYVNCVRAGMKAVEIAFQNGYYELLLEICLDKNLPVEVQDNAWMKAIEIAYKAGYISQLDAIAKNMDMPIVIRGEASKRKEELIRKELISRIENAVKKENYADLREICMDKTAPLDIREQAGIKAVEIAYKNGFETVLDKEMLGEGVPDAVSVEIWKRKIDPLAERKEYAELTAIKNRPDLPRATIRYLEGVLGEVARGVMLDIKKMGKGGSGKTGSISATQNGLQRTRVPAS